MPILITRLTAIFLIISSCGGLSCSGIASNTEMDPDRCIDREIARIRGLPEHRHIQTLDGRRVSLDQFYAQCRQLGAKCALPPKFYHWNVKTIDVQSKAAEGMITHRMRVYANPVSACFPDRTDPGRIYGDVAELYDVDGNFMGLVTYMGRGLYVPLSFSGYHRSSPGSD